MLSEVQVAFFVFFVLISLYMGVFLPHHSKAGKLYDFSRRLLTLSIVLSGLHFVPQFLLLRYTDEVGNCRAIVNLLFAIPISYLTNISYLYLQRRGAVTRFEWLLAPVFFVIAVLMVGITLLVGSLDALPQLHTVLALAYSVTLYYYVFDIFREYRRIGRFLNTDKDARLTALLKWTKWSTILRIGVSLGYPLMIFVNHFHFRASYGFLALAAMFFYLLTFISMGLTYVDEVPRTDVESSSVKLKMDIYKVDQIRNVVETFIADGEYLKAGLTIRDAAVAMGISTLALKNWLRTTPHEKFNSWITYLRIEKSKEMLLNNPSIGSEELAEKCGFCDRQYFQHKFLQQEGITPSKWLKKLQEAALEE